MRRTPEERLDHYRRLLVLHAGSPRQPIADFCARHGISVWTFYHWRKRIASPAPVPTRQPVPAFLPVTLAPAVGFEVLFPNGIRMRTTQPLGENILSAMAAVKTSGSCSG